MSAPRFVHLRLHTEYSVVDGMARVDDAVAAAAADGMPALGITDAGNVFGAVKFYAAARSNGVQPVVARSHATQPVSSRNLWITMERRREGGYRVGVLCGSRAVGLNFCELV